MSRRKAEELSLTPLAVIGSHGVVAGPDASLQEQPANAIKKACAREGITVSDLDLLEINEAFAAVGVVSMRALGVDADIVNVNGGAIALGHRSACRAPGSSCTSPSNFSDAAAAPERRRCAAAAARGMPSSSEYPPDPTTHLAQILGVMDENRRFRASFVDRARNLGQMLNGLVCWEHDEVADRYVTGLPQHEQHGVRDVLRSHPAACGHFVVN